MCARKSASDSVPSGWRSGENSAGWATHGFGPAGQSEGVCGDAVAIDETFGVEDRDHVGRVLEQRLVAMFRVEHGGLQPSVLGRVADGKQHRLGFAEREPPGGRRKARSFAVDQEGNGLLVVDLAVKDGAQQRRIGDDVRQGPVGRDPAADR